MNSKDYSKVTEEAQRGFLFQTYSTLLYLLVRRIESSELSATDFSIVVEPDEGEDAKFLSTILENNSRNKVVELVQCKKRESGKSDSLHAGMMPGDEWAQGEVNFKEFSEWITKKRPQHSAEDFLASDDNTYYTVIIFGSVAKRIRNFVPREVRESQGLKWYSPMFAKSFPINYRHQQDPEWAQLPKNTFATAEIRRRIRVLVVDSPSEIEAQCILLLIQYEKVSAAKAPDIVRRLRIEIENRATLKEGGTRSFSSGDIETIIAQGRVAQGSWQASQRFLPQNSQPADLNRGQQPQWVDFENDRYCNRDEFAVAWEALKKYGYIVVSGPAGTGKTTLSRYLAFKYLKEKYGQRVYYLRINPSEALDDESQFFETQIYSKTLFIVDDQHLAPDEVEKIAKLFVEIQLEQKVYAWLVIVSTTNYGRTRLTETSTYINQAESIRLLPVDKGAMSHMLDSLRSRASLNTPLSNDELTSLSKGNIGLALIIARCAQDFKKYPSWHQLFNSRTLKQTLKEWILEQLHRSGDHKFYDQEVAPIFLIGSTGLLIPNDFNSYVGDLFTAGFLERRDTFGDEGTAFYPTNIKLALIISQQNEVGQGKDEQGRKEAAIFFQFMKRYPEQFSAMFGRLTETDEGRNILLELCRSNFNHIAHTLGDPYSSADVQEVSLVLRSVHMAARGESYRLLKALAAPKAAPDIRFFTNFIHLTRVKSLRSLTYFLDTLYHMDSFLVRRLAREQLGAPHARTILTLFDLSFSHLDEIAHCLRALSRFNRKFTIDVYERLKRSDTLEQKIIQTEDGNRSLSVWLRFCNALRQLNLHDAYSYAEEHLTSEKILDAILNHPESNPLYLLLLRLRRINPKLSAQVVLLLWQNHKDRLIGLIERQDDISAINNDLYSLSQLSRRVAIKVALQTRSHVCDRVSKETRYSKIGSAIESFHKNLGIKISSAAASAIDREYILPLIQAVDRKIDYVGKFLYSLAQVSVEAASWFEEHLDYKEYLQRIHSLRLHNLVYLVRGLLTATHPTRKAALLDSLLADKVLINEFNLGWSKARNLSEVAFTLLYLLDIPVRKSDILQLLGIQNLAFFERDILIKLARERSTLHVAMGLYAVAKFDFEIGIIALQEYVERTEARIQQGEQRNEEGHERRALVETSLQLPDDYEPHNLDELARLFMAATSIESRQATQLALLIDINKFIDYAVEETNLGRLSIFINGLNRASRKLARDFTISICSEEIWRRQCAENIDIENIVHYARAISQVSASKASEFIHFVFEYSSDEIAHYLEMEVNLKLASNWLRVARVGSQELLSKHVNNLVGYLLSAVDYDTRVHHLIEASEALIECGEKQLAVDFANKAIKESGQLRTIRKLHQWIDIFHKAIRIGRELNIPDFQAQLFSNVIDWHFTIKLRFENQAILLAYTLYLFKSLETNGLENIRKSVFLLRKEILNAVRSERLISHRALALIFAEAPIEEIQATVQGETRFRPWEQGLAAILFATVFPDEPNPFTSIPIMTPDQWENLLSQGMSEHTNNIEFGLTLHLAALTGSSQQFLERFSSIAADRASDEIVGAYRWLLQQPPGVINLNQKPHYLWILIRNTVLRSTYLSQEIDLDKEAGGGAYRE